VPSGRTRRQVSGYLFIDYRGWTERITIVVVIGVFLVIDRGSDSSRTFDAETRRELYSSLASSSGALLGFVLAALAILIALPSAQRLEALRSHPRWSRVPEAFLRAARALLMSLVLCSLGIPLDSDEAPSTLYEVLVLLVLASALVRAIAAVVALDQVIFVARAESDAPPPVVDP
jgi:hypothetical protein